MKAANIIFFTALFLSGLAQAQDSQDFSAAAQQLLSNHYQHYKDREYFSGASLSIYIPGEDVKNFYIGNVSHDPGSKKITADTLFQIGSITKSFTSAIILQLEKEGKLTIDNTLNEWLPDYKKWSPITLKRLLNMTSGLPNYSKTPLWNTQQFYNPEKVWTNEDLINFVYPQGLLTPPLKTGYFRSDTNYILSEMIIKKITHHTFQSELFYRTIKPAGLNNTYYVDGLFDMKIKARMAHGYNFNPYDNPSLVGKEIENNNLSWAAAAGGVVSNSEDTIKWVKALFVDNNILDAAQKQKLTELVSTRTGKSINETSINDKHAFGLGVTQAYDKNNLLEHYWYYEGKTMGFRAVYLYTPCNGVIISSVFNSATNAENDHAGELMKKAFKLIIDQYPQLRCGKVNNKMAKQVIKT